MKSKPMARYDNRFRKNLTAELNKTDSYLKQVFCFLFCRWGIICDYENGRRIPSPAKAAEIAEALGEIESYWVQIAVQDYLRQYNLNYKVKLT